MGLKKRTRGLLPLRAILGLSLLVVVAVVGLIMVVSSTKLDFDTRGQAAQTSFVLDEQFDQEPTGEYSVAQLKSRFNPPWENGVNEKLVSIVESPESYAGKSLKVKFPQGWKTEGIGVLFVHELPSRHDELYLSYRVKFADNFAFVKGGKLPGLAGGLGNTGLKKPTGTDGWSVRTMWRAGGAAVQYVYHPDQANDYGDDIPYNVGGQRYFIPGKWHLIQTRIKLNTPGSKNGIIQTWFDGSLAVDAQNIRFRDVPGLGIDKLRFESFFGGNDATWGPVKDESILFDSVQISTKPFREWQSSSSQVTPTPTSSTPTSSTPRPTASPQTPSVTPASNALKITFEQTKTWDTGFCVRFKVTNTSSTTISDWQATFQLNQAQLDSSWSGQFTKSDNGYAVKPYLWGQSIKASRTRSFGYCGTKKGTSYLPSNVTVSY